MYKLCYTKRLQNLAAISKMGWEKIVGKSFYKGHCIRLNKYAGYLFHNKVTWLTEQLLYNW